MADLALKKQKSLAILGFYRGRLDGIFGRKSLDAEYRYFKSGGDSLEQDAAKLMPKNFGKTKADFIAACSAFCMIMGLTESHQIAYVLATVEHETAGTFKPVREGLKRRDAWRKKNLRYYPFYGRGYVQLTWRFNYYYYSLLLGEDFLRNPDKVMDRRLSLFILVHGMRNGIFTGKALDRYVRKDHVDFKGARKVINGSDKDDLIAELADKHLDSLKEVCHA